MTEHSVPDTITWSPDLSIGHDLIDDQHQKLFSLANKLAAATQIPSPLEAASEIFCELADYAFEHFSLEEELMRISHYGDSPEHIVAHWSFLQQLSVFITDFEKGRASAIRDCLGYLQIWFKEHISIEDKRLGRHLAHPAYRSGSDTSPRNSA